MSERARQLTDEFDQALNSLIDTIRSTTDGEWEQICAAEGWPVAVVADHIAVWLDIELEWICRIAAGRPVLPLSMDAIDSFNASHAQHNAGVTKDQVLQTLTNNASAARHVISHLTDEQLAITLPTRAITLSARSTGPERSLDTLVQHFLIRHLKSHHASIQRTIGG